ncbi:Squamosa promoter-binding-like protein 15 [Rhynchospora pubera]|uniref:Squamosa promoter-binding-like protein 15 n=1 Tax=Rhynchospora pubera TaxID=906938 RepID=A0AAV8H626_9POAL|nr:Squamosa promoter-binding-like protein 15 [Rhynchospora pubera]
MEGGEVGAQVAAPMFFHKGLPGQFHEPAKKRSLPWQNNPTGFHQTQVVGPHQPNPAGNWNPSAWNWDSIRFTARHVPDLTGAAGSHGDQSDQMRRAHEERSNTSPFQNNMEIDGAEGLTLNLGARVYSGGDRAAAASSPPSANATPTATPVPGVTVAVPSQEQALRPNKRVRSGSPGSGGGGAAGGAGAGAAGGYPMCQVDDCRADLSGAKDYHRRHKVCEVHSKTTKALVGKQMQRFCQQCSRFHPLSEFDEGKRSCRRRLAGHNRRRRKTQPTDVASQLLLPGSQDGVSNANLNIVNILTALARLQGNSADKSPSVPPMPDRDGLIQIISKLSSLSGANQPAKSLPSGGGFDLNISEETQQDSVEQHTTNGIANETAPSTLNLLAVLSAASLAASAPNKPILSNSQGSSDSSGNDKGKTQCVESPNDVTKGFTRPVKEQSLTGPCLGLQLFGSSGDESPPKMGSTTTKYLSSESSNPMEEQSPSASPPITRKFFPIHSASEVATDSEAIRISDYKEDGVPVEVSTSRCQPFDLFKDVDRHRKAARNGASPVTYASSSGSDHSPSTSNSDSQDRTGRIVFKLFGKDPSSFPQNIRDQINNWLSSSPTDMESYIRPGCVVLSVYLSMPAFAWDELEENLLQRVTSLVETSDSDFWKNGRFLVRTNRQLVSHKDGMIRLSKSWRTWSSPEVACVSPVAVVGGQKTSLALRGRNLTVPGTKIFCTHMGKYLSKEVLCSAYPGTIYDDCSVEKFDFPGDEPPISLGRCFIEVENGFKGNSFPVIVASSAICEELRTLETEFEDLVTGDVIGEENGLPRSRGEILHFLNELGWLFQKEANSSSLNSNLIEFSVTRFKNLLVFSVERDWCVVTKTLLDMLAKRSSGNETLAQESLETVGEIHLLNRAVRRKCRKMVDMLLHFSVTLNDDGNNSNTSDSREETKMYPFIPSQAGPNGWTPLHLAASSDAADEIIDALTDDPQQIGLSCWDTLRDESKQTPQMYAAARNKHSYNELVVRKRIDRKNGQVSISVCEGEDGISVDKSAAGENSRSYHFNALQINAPPATTCAQCAMMEAAPCIRPTRRGGLLGRPYVLSMLGIAAVCVCVCLFMRARLRINYGRSFKWETLDFGAF